MELESWKKKQTADTWMKEALGLGHFSRLTVDSQGCKLESSWSI
jgi:hypothetical protein